MIKIKLIVSLLAISLCSYSQNVFIKRDNKLVDLDQLKNLKIHQYKQSGGKDSVYCVTETDSLIKSGDTLLVVPFAVEEIHYLDANNFITIEKVSKENAKQLMKIPLSEIDQLTGKKRSISGPLSWISTLAFVGVATSFVLRMGNEDVRTVGTNVFLTSAPVLILGWTLQATVAKKRYHFDKTRTKKKTWQFN